MTSRFQHRWDGPPAKNSQPQPGGSGIGTRITARASVSIAKLAQGLVGWAGWASIRQPWTSESSIILWTSTTAVSTAMHFRVEK